MPLKIGGEFGYRLLRWISPGGPVDTGGTAYAGRSKLAVQCGAEAWDRIRDKVVVDFGCGRGSEAIELARRGAKKVIGLDIQSVLLESGRDAAMAAGVSDLVSFTSEIPAAVDVIVSLDSFEHFADPAGVLRTMASMLTSDGVALVAFGPTWYHPLGGHLFSIFPWAHLLFTEQALVRWRSGFRDDGATRFGEVAGGLNQMTIERFERLVAESPLRFEAFETVPIRRLRLFAGRWTREWTTAIVRCRLVHR